MRRLLAGTAVLAIGAPVGAALWVSARRTAAEARLSAAAGEPARIGGIDAALTGTVRLTDVAIGDVLAADSIEASVGLDSLLAGELRADEVRVQGPRVALRVDADGDSDLARLLRRLGGGGGSAAAPGRARPSRVRRIIVTEGSLVAHVAGIGDLEADDVELVPDASGVRVVTGAVRVRSDAGPVHARLAFSRAAADVSLPRLAFRRVLAVGGAGSIAVATNPPLAVHDLAAGRLSPGGALQVRGDVDDGGAARPVSLEVSPRDFAVAIRGTRVPLRAFASLAPRGFTLDGARASGALVVRRTGDKLALDIDGALDGAALDHPAIAPQPVPLAGAVKAHAAIGPDAVTVSDASFDVGAAHVRASGWLRRALPLAGQLDVQLAPAACADLLATIPAQLRVPLDGLALGGTIGGRARLSLDLAAPDGDGVALETSLAGGCTALAEPPAADVTKLAAADPPLLHHLPDHVSGAFIAAEDAHFWEHHGFDQEQIARSLEIDLREQRVARGGSTISQQLVKNAFLTQRRSLDRKLQEAILTWRLEARLDKHQILERYLEVIELGPHVAGLAAAARHWFDCAPHDLTIRQSAFLAALTAEPASMSRRVRRAGGLDADSAARVDVVLRNMKRDGIISADDLDAAKGAPMRFAKSALKPD